MKLRNEEIILRLLLALPPSEREKVQDVGRGAVRAGDLKSWGRV